MSRPTEDPAAFVEANTAVERPYLVPEIQLRLANELVPLWEATESELDEIGLPPPYWAFAWAGGQALARYLLDHPDLVVGKRVLDFAAGCGIQGIAAAQAGAARVEASEIDRFAIECLKLNTGLNGVTIEIREEDLVGLRPGYWDVVLAGDVCYERPMAERVWAWLQDLAAAGSLVLIGDPGRSYLPRSGLERITAYAVKTTREIEDSDLRNAAVWRVAAKDGSLREVS